MRVTVFAVAIVWVVGLNVGAVPAQEWGLSVSTNFASLLPIGLLQELPLAPTLVGLGGYGRFAWIWSLHARPWGQLYLGEDRNRFAGGLDLLWGNPDHDPHLAYVGFGLTVTDFLPLPVTNFVLGYETGDARCNVHLEARLPFLNSFQLGWGCGF